MPTFEIAASGQATYAQAPYGFNLTDRCVGTLSRQIKIQVTSESFLALPMLLRGTQLITLLQARLGAQLKQAADIRLLEAPVPIRPLVMSMFWHPLYNNDAAHSWLRSKILEVAQRS